MERKVVSGLVQALRTIGTEGDGSAGEGGVQSRPTLRGFQRETSTMLNRLLGPLGVLLLALSTLLVFGGLLGGVAWARTAVVIYACADKSGQIRLVDSPEKCKPNESLLGALATTRLAADVSPAGDSATPGSNVAFSDAFGVASVAFLGGGRYCIFPSNPGAFNLTQPIPFFFVRPLATSPAQSDTQATAMNNPCNSVAGGPVGFHVQMTLGVDSMGNPADANDVGFVIEVP